MEETQGSTIILSWQIDLEPSEMVTDGTSVWAAPGPEKRKLRPLGFTFPQAVCSCLDVGMPGFASYQNKEGGERRKRIQVPNECK